MEVSIEVLFFLISGILTILVPTYKTLNDQQVESVTVLYF